MKFEFTQAKKLVNWISTSFQNKDGKVCSKRATVFALTSLDAFIIFFKLANPNAIAAMGIITPAILAILLGKDYYERKTMQDEINSKPKQ